MSNKLPVIPYMVSSIGRMWTLLPYGISPGVWMITKSPRRTLILVLTTLLRRILPSSSSLSTKAMQTVSRRFLPFMRIVSPLMMLSSFILAWDSTATELSSFVASSTMSLLGPLLRVSTPSNFWSS